MLSSTPPARTMIMRVAPSLLRTAATLALSLPLAAAAQVPASLELNDLTSGSGSAGGPVFGIASGHEVEFVVGGEPGELVLLLVGPLSAGPAPPLIAGVPLNLDLTSAFVLANGLANPAAQVGAGGSYALPLSLPGGLPLGAVIYTQAALVELPTLGLRLTPGLDLVVVCGNSAPSFSSYTATGSAATTGHFANALAITVNDPAPKLIAPGNQFIGGHSDQLLLHPIDDPMSASHSYTWNPGDELGWFRDRLTLDGSNPGIDRIFFVARQTTAFPNFVDWDGAGFSNETVLAAADGSIQRLCVTDGGDLLGNDFFGKFYLWEKAADYQRKLLFQISNHPGSVPWGDSLDKNLGKIGYDPFSGLILLPINNPAVSDSGQLYGFDLFGNRLLVDQDLMGVAPPGVNSYRFGVTLDLQQPGCRVMVHGGRDQGPFFVARFSGGMTAKTISQVAGDSHGGWIGGLHGSRFFTNTNSASYGIVERALPLDW